MNKMGIQRTPPSWLRFVVPWSLLQWISNRSDRVCWANMVMWKMCGHDDWYRSPLCFRPYDYCGKFLVDDRNNLFTPVRRRTPDDPATVSESEREIPQRRGDAR